MNSGILITIYIFRKILDQNCHATLFHLLVHAIIIKTSCIVTYFLHLPLLYAIHTNGTWNAKLCPVVKEDMVCRSRLIHISEN